MTIEHAIEILATINFLVIGLSHIIQHRAWAEFFALLRSHGRPGAFVNGFLSLLGGSLIVGFHNVWSGIPALLTLLGWAMVIKSLVIFLSPDLGLRSMDLAGSGKSYRVLVSGLICVGFGLLLVYELWHG